MTDYGPVVTSTQNQWAKYARSLERRKVRYQERAFLVEGVRLIADALDADAEPKILFFTSDNQSAQSAEIVGAAAAKGARVVPVNSPVLQAIAATETPQGVAAIFPFPQLPLSESRSTPLFLIADAIRDPGNLGTLLRSALGSGTDAVFIAPGTVDPFAPKVVRAGMGAHFRLPIRHLRWETPDPLIMACRHRYAAAAEADLAYDRADWTSSTCLIVGNEAVGISASARELSTDTISIPLAGSLESLNAGIAGAVLLFEAARQRRER